MAWRLRKTGGKKRQKQVALGALALFVVIGAYRMLAPVDGQVTIAMLLLGATTILFLLRESTTPEQIRDIRRERRQLEPYVTHVTILITGVIVLLIMYLLTYGFMALAYVQRGSDLIPALFFELIQHIRLFEAFHPLLFAAAYVAAATLLSVAVLIVYPITPIRSTSLATTVSFLIAWAYVLSLAYLLLPLIHALTYYALLIDAGLIVVWAILFDHMYGKPLVSRRIYRRT